SAAVARIEATLDAGSWPQVRLRLGVYDAAGAPVDGVGPADVPVTEGGAPMAAAITTNRREGRRVLIVADQSESVDAAFRGDAFVTLVGNVFDEIVAVEPDVTFGVALIVGGIGGVDFVADRASV